MFTLSDETKNNLINSILQDTLSKPSNKTHPYFVVGKSYFFRNITFHLIGTIAAIDENGITLQAGTVSYVANSGRFMQSIDDGILNEVEPVKTSAYINLNALVDAFEWCHPLPRKQQ